MRRERDVCGFAFGNTARGSKLGNHARYVVGADVQASPAAETVFDVPPVEFCFSGQHPWNS